MKSIEALVIVTPDGKLDVQAQGPVDITPGEYRAVLEIEDPPTEGDAHRQITFSSYDIPWPEGISLRREDMYGDDGR